MKTNDEILQRKKPPQHTHTRSTDYYERTQTQIHQKGDHKQLGLNEIGNIKRHSH